MSRKSMRLIQYEYFELSELPIGEIPYTAIENALQDEIYFRKFQPTNYRDDLASGTLASLLYWYPEYINILYEYAVDDKDFMLFFKPFPTEIRDGFVFLYPEVMKKLKKVRRKVRTTNHFDEIKI